jgi:hypothetical protein
MKTTLVSVLSGIAAVVAFSGCESLPPDTERGPDGTVAYNTVIEASEPGARVEVNGEIIGNTPLTLKIFGDKDGTFHDFGSFEYVVRALPVTTNQFAQVRSFRTGRLFTPEDHIPQRIYFDMNQPPAQYPPTYYSGPPSVYYYGPPVYYGPRVYVGPRWHYRHW